MPDPRYPRAYHQSDQMIIAQVKARPILKSPKAARKYLSLWRAFVLSRLSGRFVGICRLVYCMVDGGISSVRLGINHDAS